jgi:hypothetical protein
MNANLERRLAALKAQIGGNPVYLHMPDGSVRQIAGTNTHYFRLWLLSCDIQRAREAGEPIPESPFASELDWLVSAVTVDEEDGQRYMLLQAMLQGPNEDGEGLQICVVK